jgi:predicted short-subunit dehydrogenase-like oxidoreductase (DUF2520 family)
LNDLKHLCHIAQFHPLVSLSGERAIPARSLVGICANEVNAHDRLTALARQLDLTPQALAAGSQTLYHVAAVLCGNLSLGLVEHSITLMREAGIDEIVSRPALAQLLRSAADAVEGESVANALTGPLARGDIGTVRRHLDALAQLSQPEIECLYRTLSQQLVKHHEHDHIWPDGFWDSDSRVSPHP